MAKEIKVTVSSEDIKLVNLFSNCYTVAEAAEELGINKRTLEKRILLMKKTYNCKTLPGLVALFFRNKLL